MIKLFFAKHCGTLINGEKNGNLLIWNVFFFLASIFFIFIFFVNYVFASLFLCFVFFSLFSYFLSLFIFIDFLYCFTQVHFLSFFLIYLHPHSWLFPILYHLYLDYFSRFLSSLCFDDDSHRVLFYSIFFSWKGFVTTLLFLTFAVLPWDMLAMRAHTFQEYFPIACFWRIQWWRAVDL